MHAAYEELIDRRDAVIVAALRDTAAFLAGPPFPADQLDAALEDWYNAKLALDS